MKKGSEEAGQIVLMNWLKRQDYEVWEKTFHCPNGVKTGGSKQARIIEGSRLKLMGVKPGVPDLITLQGNDSYVGIVQELKADKGRLSADQQAWLNIFMDAGFKVYVPWGLAEAVQNYVEFYGWVDLEPVGGEIAGF